MCRKINCNRNMFYLLFAMTLLLPTRGSASNWYVDQDAAGSSTGGSWDNAWKGFSSVQWDLVQPGDTIFLSGGSTSKTYNETLSVGKSGLPGAPVTIRVGQDAGHNGLVIIDKNWTDYFGISLSGVNYVIISGQHGSDPGCGIKVTRASYSGVSINGNSHDFDIGYVEVTGNGNRSNVQGIQVSVAPHTSLGQIHHCIIHNNYEDEIWLNSTSGTPVNIYGSLKFHHNDIYEFHADAVKIALSGVDFYNNSIHDRGLRRADHPDGIQGWSRYLRIFNNNFYNFTRVDDAPNENSYIRYNPDGATGHDANPVYLHIYNNYFTEYRAPGSGSVFRGVELSFSDPTLSSINHVYVMNNTFAGIPYFGLFVGFKNTMSTSDVSDILIENNMFINSSRNGWGNAVLIVGNKGDGSINYGSYGSGADVIIDYNSFYASSSTYNRNISYLGGSYTVDTFRSTSGCQNTSVTSNPILDPNLIPYSDSPLKGSGINLSTFFSIDKADATRPATTGWTIGAYEALSFPGGKNPMPPSNVQVN